MRLFRQATIGRWDDVAEQIELELNAMLDPERTSAGFAVPEAVAAALHV
jgi:hypothetical protein